MRGRLLLAFTVLAAICMAALAVGTGGQLAASQTRSLLLDRLGDADRFAALSAAPARLADEAQHYHERDGSGVLVIAADGRVRVARGIDPSDPGVAGIAERAKRFEPSPLPPTLYPWHTGTVLLARPIGAPPMAGGVVVLAVATGETTTAITDGWIQLAVLTVTALLVAAGVAMVLSGWILRPISGLLRAVDALTATLPTAAGASRRAPGRADGPKEILELADAVETLTRAVAEFATAERRNVADTAHSLRNPLAALAVRLETLHPVIAGGGAESIFDSVVSEVDRLTGLLDGLLAVAVSDAQHDRGGRPDARPSPRCDATEVAAGRVEAWHAAFTRAGMTLTTGSRTPGAEVAVPAPILEQILDVALSNSSRYAGAGAHATVAVERECDSVVITVRDDGIGVPDDEIDRLTTRFFRGANAADGGSGLGLPIAAALAGKHGGLFFLEPAEPRGLMVTVSFPAMFDPAAAGPAHLTGG